MAASVPPEVLALFWELAAVEAGKREAAAETLARELKAAQAAFEAEGGKPAPLPEAGGAAGALAPLVGYALRRLARGLGSGREGARQGFALALTGALGAVGCVTGEQAVAILEDNSEPVTGSSKGPEARDIYLGKLFGFAAIARALEARRGSREGASPALLSRMAQEVALLARKKGYLREAGASILLELLQPLRTEALARVLKEAPALADWLCCPLETTDAEALLLALELADRLPPAWQSRCPIFPPASPSGMGALFERGHLAALLPALLTSTSAHPRTHSVWPALIRLLLRLPNATAAVESFWDVACEQSLFTSSHSRKFLGFELFSMLLPGLTSETVPALFSHNFMRCLVNSLNKDDTLLHAAASRCLSNLLAFVKSDAGAPLQSAVIAALQRFAGGRFDKLTQTTAVSALMQSLAGDSAADYVQTLFASFLSADPEAATAGAADESAAEEAAHALAVRRAWSVEQLCGVCRSTRAPALQMSVSRFLLLHSFFEQGAAPPSQKLLAALPELGAGAPRPPLAAAQRELCRTRLFGLLAESQAAAHATAPRDAPGDEAAAEARRAQAAAAVSQLSELSEACALAERLLPSAAPLDEDALRVRASLRALLPDLDRLAAGAGASGRPAPLALRADVSRSLLRLLLLVQLGSPAEYTSELEDLPRCLCACLEAAGGALAAAPARPPAGADAPHHMDVMVEVLLSLTAKPSALTRDAVERTFRAFAPDLTREGLGCMLRVITRRSDGGGRRTRGAGDGEDESESESDEDGEEEEEEEEAEVPVDRRASGGRRSAPEQSESESEEDAADGMDDDAMFRADSLLAAVLTQTKAARSGKKSAAEAQTHFKFRVLSLVEAFVKSQPSSPLLLDMVVPLLRAIFAAQGTGENEALASRLSGLLSGSICRAAAPAGASLEQLQSSFGYAFRHASRSGVPAITRPAIAASLYLLRLLDAAEKAPVAGGDAVRAHLRSSLELYWGSKKCRLPHSFFVTLLERFPAASGCALDFLSEQLVAASAAASFTGRSEFLAIEAAKLSAVALRRKPGSPTAAAVAGTLQPAAVLRGLTAALGLRLAKPKRQTEMVKQLAGCVAALLRLCAAQQLPLPGCAQLLAAARAAKIADPLPPPSALAQLDRIIEAVRVAGAAGGAAPPGSGKKRARGGA